MIYAYGICAPVVAAPPPDRRGLGGAALRALENEGIAAVYSRHRSLRPDATPGLVLAHERVVEAIMERGAVLPLRFGTELDGEDALHAALAERRNELLRGLEYVQGHVELGLRVTPGHPSRTARPADTGSDYMMSRVAAHRQRRRAATAIHAPLAELARACVLRPRPAPPAVLVATYLVDAGAVDRFRDRAVRSAAPEDDLRISVTGPWPPYSFVDGGGRG